MTPDPLAGHSILVLADEPFTAYCLDILLKGAGADVQCADSVREANALLERHRPSAVVLDTRSRTDIKQVRRRLLVLGIPCIVCSNDARDEHRAGGPPILPRPVSGTHLIEVLSRFNTAAGEALPPTQAASHQPSA